MPPNSLLLDLNIARICRKENGQKKKKKDPMEAFILIIFQKHFYALTVNWKCAPLNGDLQALT